MAKAFGIVSKPSFSQSTVVIAAVGGAWILWLAAQNKLLLYWQILMGQGGAGATTTGSGTVGGPVSGNVTSLTGTPGASVNATVSPAPSATGNLLGDYATPNTATIGDTLTGGGLFTGL